jgi:uncharacterized Zn finger protein (UPF0148 family)
MRGHTIPHDCEECPGLLAIRGDGTVYCPSCETEYRRDDDLDREPDHAPVDEEFVHARLDELERLLTDGGVPISVRRHARDKLEQIRAELDPTRVRTEAER